MANNDMTWGGMGKGNQLRGHFSGWLSNFLMP